MHSFVISSKNLEKGIEEARNISKKENVDFFDIEILEFEGLGIEDIRRIQKKIFLKPFKGDKKSLVIVLSGSVSDEAQNSMLKMLEEPPQSSLIFLVMQNHQSLLPTIISRVKIIELKEEREIDNLSIDEISKINTDGDALTLAQNLSKDRNQAIIWLENLILSLRKNMIEEIKDRNQAITLKQMINKIELAHYDLKNTNTNARLILENLFLNIK